MRNFHPLTILIFFSAMIFPLMLVSNPVLAGVSLAGAVIMLLTVRNGGRGLVREIAGYIAVFLIMSAVNPLFVHRGRTPLFFLNGRAVTLEAVLYGLNSALLLVTAVIWCRSFSVVMTSDRLFCLMGRLSPKITAMLTTAVRFIPDMLAQGHKISDYSRTSGKFDDTSLIGKIKRTMSVFSALVTWSIENGVQTADSMKARGFELGGRTSYSKYRFSAEDAVLISLSVISSAVVLATGNSINLQFYPAISYNHDAPALISASFSIAASYLFPAVFAVSVASRRRKFSRQRTLKTPIGK